MLTLRKWGYHQRHFVQVQWYEGYMQHHANELFIYGCGYTDQKALLRLCPRLINEMISILNQVWVYAKYRPSECGREGGREGPCVCCEESS